MSERAACAGANAFLFDLVRYRCSHGHTLDFLQYRMASRTAVSALPWHHSMLDVDARAGLAGATLGLGAENRRSALTFRYSGIRNRRYCTSIFHDDGRPRLPAAKSGGGLAEAFLPPATPLLPLEHELSEAGVLWAEWYRGALGRSATRSP